MLRQFRKLEEREFLVAGYDLSSGAKDYCAVQFVSKSKIDVPLVIHSPKTASETTNFVVQVLEKIYETTRVPPVIAPETNAGGSYEIDRMLAMNRLNSFRIWQQPAGVGMIERSEPRRYGWTTTAANRPKMLADLKQAIDNRVLRIYDRKTINEMYSFIIVRETSVWKARAENNSFDDLVMSLAIAWQLYLSVPEPAKTEDLHLSLPEENIFNEEGFYF